MTLARSSASIPLQKALYSRLTTDITTTPIFDQFVPQKQPMPYIQLGEHFRTEDNTKVEVGEMLLSTINVWSDEPGTKQLKEIMDEIEVSIFRAHLDLTADGFKHLYTEMSETEAFQDEDGKAQHGVIKIRFQIEKI